MCVFKHNKANDTHLYKYTQKQLQISIYMLIYALVYIFMYINIFLNVYINRSIKVLKYIYTHNHLQITI